MADTDTPPPPATKHSSWRLDTDVADQLAAAVDDLHHATRRPKREVIGVTLLVGLAHRDEIEALLAAGGDR